MKNLLQQISLFSLAAILMISTATSANANSCLTNDTGEETKEYILLFRTEGVSEHKPSPEQIQETIKAWGSWIGGIAANGGLVRTNQVGQQAAVVKKGAETQKTPFTEATNIVGGYMIIKTTSLDNAIEIAQKCPILNIGGSVEVRNIIPKE